MITYRHLTPPSEFLIHAADVEGLCRGIDTELVRSKYFVYLYMLVGD